ncbi:MAG: hypothetical protein KDD55_01350 [Bdellovibrionales bacterium]|nr:hypothetical protein [Bdellovibrionales bacterium]
MEFEQRQKIEERLLLHGVLVVLLLFLFSFFTSKGYLLSIGAALGVIYAKGTVWLFFSVAETFVSETRKNPFPFLLIPLKLPIVLLVLYGLYLFHPQLVLGFLVGLVVLLTAPLSAALDTKE